MSTSRISRGRRTRAADGLAVCTRCEQIVRGAGDLVSGPVLAMAGATVVTSTVIPDGRLIVADLGDRDSLPTLVVGVTSTETHEQAHRIVRAGLADVLRWLGLPTLTGWQLIDAWRGDGQA